MSQPTTFENFSPLRHEVYAIGEDIGSIGVIPEMAIAFDHDLSNQPDEENLGELIAKVGPARTLQDNIAHVRDVLGDDAVDISRDWVERLGLLQPVERSYLWASDPMPSRFSAAVITGGVRNWMQRRADILIQSDYMGDVILVAGNREMREAEGPDVEAGMTEADYMRTVVAPRLKAAGTVINATLVAPITSAGDDVMRAGTWEIDRQTEISDPRTKILVASNAGAWVQNAGQLRRALKQMNPDFDMGGDQLFVLGDSFELGTGVEPTATHQNPLSALGQIVRNAQELVRHKA